MSVHNHNHNAETQIPNPPGTPGRQVTHSKELALSEREFELLLDGCRQIPCELRSLEAQFIAFAAGRLGLRSGEIVHIRAEWVDWREQMIRIPAYQPCTKGRDGGLCGSCRQSARQRVEYADVSLNRGRLAVVEDALGPRLPGAIVERLKAIFEVAVYSGLADDVVDDQLRHLLVVSDAVSDAHIDPMIETLDAAADEHRRDNALTQADAERLMWRPKTEAGARDIPFGWNPRVELVVERYFDRFDGFERSQTAINRRVHEALDLAPGLDRDTTTPHGLRATAATELASRGLGELALQNMLGWVSLSTARDYVASTPKNTRRELNAIHSR